VFLLSRATTWTCTCSVFAFKELNDDDDDDRHSRPTVGGVAQWSGRRPLAGGLSLICA